MRKPSTKLQLEPQSLAVCTCLLPGARGQEKNLLPFTPGHAAVAHFIIHQQHHLGALRLCMPWKQNASFCLPGEQTSAFAVPGSAVACHAPDLPSSGRQRATYRTLTGAYSENWRFKSRRSAETAPYSFSRSSPGMLFLPAACRLPPLPLYHRWNLVRSCS